MTKSGVSLGPGTYREVLASFMMAISHKGYLHNKFMDWGY